MEDEYDFSKGKRGASYRKGAKLRLPLTLDDSVQAALAELADAKGQDYSTFVNELLIRAIDLLATENEDA